MSSLRKLIVLAGLTFLARILFIVVFPHPIYYKGISEVYPHVAENILLGKGAVILTDIGTLSGPSTMSYEPFIDRPLGYVVLVLVPSLIAFHPLSIEIFQAILGACSTVMLFRIGCSIFSELVAFRASLLYAIWPINARLDTLILPDGVMSFFLLLGLWLFLQAVDMKKPIHFFLLPGLVFGAGMLMRPDISLLPFFLIMLMLISRHPPKRILASVLLIAGVSLALLPQTVHNYNVTKGKIIPLGLGSGISLWEGISQFGDTLGTVYGDDRMTAREGYRSWAYPDGVERDRKRFREAVGIILDHPIWYLGVMARRIPVLLKPDGIVLGEFLPAPRKFFKNHPEATLRDYVSAYPLTIVVQTALVLSQITILLLAGFTAFKDSRDRRLWIPATAIFYYIVIHLPTNAEARYFYPVIPLILLLASQAMEHVLGRTQEGYHS